MQSRESIIVLDRQACSVPNEKLDNSVIMSVSLARRQQTRVPTPFLVAHVDFYATFV
jgi:hypothetical protein